MGGGRKKPFSAKQKKEQLKLKRDKKRDEDRDEFGRPVRHQKREGHGSSSHGPHAHHQRRHHHGHGSNGEDEAMQAVSLNQQPRRKDDNGYDPNRYRLHFMTESHEEIERRKKIAQQPFEMLPEQRLELDLMQLYQPGTVLDMPKRQPWNYHLSKEELGKREEQYFKKYLDDILEKHDPEELSYMELNLETWRQLWRTLEMADIVLQVTDIRHPALHFSPALYDYVTKELRKQLVLVLNKVDLAPAALVEAWKEYFKRKFPELHIVCFTSFPKTKQEEEMMGNDPGSVMHKQRKKRTYTASGPEQLLQACEDIVRGQVDLSSWREKMEADMLMTEDDTENQRPAVEVELGDGSYHGHQAYKNGVLTIGCCGYPNVGKSSLINGLMGKKVVSVSKTPGHTKHFQTIFLTPTVKLCDSPGLVFPSLVAKPLQILAGIYPIAQVREPYTSVMYLAQRLPLVQLLQLKHPEAEGQTEKDQQLQWSADDICYAWAEKRGFLTARAGRPDVYRAANSILRLALEGRLCLCMCPPGYTTNKRKALPIGQSCGNEAFVKLHCPNSEPSAM